MPTYIKTGYWDKKAKAPKEWLDLDLFCSTHGGGITLTTSGSSGPATLVGTALNIPDYSSGGVNIYNSDGTLTGNRTLNGNNSELKFINVGYYELRGNSSRYTFFGDAVFNYEYNGTEDAMSINLFTKNYYFGNLNSNGVYLEIRNNQKLISFNNNFQRNGLKLDFANSVYQLGQIVGGNTTTLKIDDASTFPVQVSGTNVSQNTSGVASGKFLKIKVDGVDYVIELKNPS